MILFKHLNLSRESKGTHIKTKPLSCKIQLKQTNGLFKLAIVGNNQGSVYKDMGEAKKELQSIVGIGQDQGISDRQQRSSTSLNLKE